MVVQQLMFPKMTDSEIAWLSDQIMRSSQEFIRLPYNISNEAIDENRRSISFDGFCIHCGEKNSWSNIRLFLRNQLSCEKCGKHRVPIIKLAENYIDRNIANLLNIYKRIAFWGLPDYFIDLVDMLDVMLDKEIYFIDTSKLKQKWTLRGKNSRFSQIINDKDIPLVVVGATGYYAMIADQIRAEYKNTECFNILELLRSNDVKIQEEIVEYFKQAEDIIDKASNEEYGYAKRWLKEITNRKYLCVFGAGTFGHMWLDLFEKYNINVDFICDNDINKWGEKFGRQIPCISPKELESFKDDVSIVVATRYSATIEKQLSNQGFVNVFIAPLEIFYFKSNFQYVGNKRECLILKKNISKLLTICVDEEIKKFVLINGKQRRGKENQSPYVGDQYFVDDIIKLDEKEIFVDAGAFDGDSIQAFLNKVNYQFEFIYGFEMDPKIYKKLSLNINNMEKYKEKILLYNIGLWDGKCEVSYSSNDMSSWRKPLRV